VCGCAAQNESENENEDGCGCAALNENVCAARNEDGCAVAEDRRRPKGLGGLALKFGQSIYDSRR
jgi:hypothetical protein